MNIRNQAIKQQIKLIQNIIKEIDKIDKETNDDVWDMGVIETSFEIYTKLENECQQILNELNIDYNMMEDGHPPETIPKAIRLIEKEILPSLINDIHDAHKLLDFAMNNNDNKFCEHAHTITWDLVKEEDCIKIIQFLIRHEPSNRNFFDVLPVDWGKQDKTIYNISDINQLKKMKEKKYIITNFNCDATLVYFTRETFKNFILENILE